MSWDQYAACFASVNTHFQRELQLAVVEELSGDVLDLGCGSAKLAPHLKDKPNINSYLGVDNSEGMLLLANGVIKSINKSSFKIQKSNIEDLHGCPGDSIVVLNSLYSWSSPGSLLCHIRSLIKPHGKLLLSNPNPLLSKLMPDLLFEAEKELLCHPFWSEFKAHNLKIVDNKSAHFWKMDKLIKRIQEAGFELQHCHQQFYLGAMNFIMATPSDQ